MSWCVDEVAIWFAGKTSPGFSFCYPHTMKSHGISGLFRRNKDSYDQVIFPRPGHVRQQEEVEEYQKKNIEKFLKKVVDNNFIT